MAQSIERSLDGPLGSIFSIIFISELDNKMECNIRKAFNGTKLCGMAGATSGKVSIQSDLRK